MSVYRSAHGKPVDMAALAAKNETVRAVGNMNVNARGDVIDNQNKVVREGTNRVKSSYNRTVGKNPTVKQQPVATQAPVPQMKIEVEVPEELTQNEQELFEEVDTVNEEEILEIKKAEKKSHGNKKTSV